MLVISRQLVLKKLAMVFPDSIQAKEALDVLDRYGKSCSEPNADLVHLAIIKLSGGELWRLRELVQKARKDFRDVVYLAQMPEQCAAIDKKSLSWGKLPGEKEFGDQASRHAAAG